jgi:predicted MPP superfamily phosphohydrolase
VSQGIELMLCGHTHNGQIMPFNLLVKRHFPYVKGLFSQAGSHLYVSTGSDTWGPVMRLGSVNEITCIDLQPG